MAERVPGIIVNIVNSTGIIAPPTFERYPTVIGEGDPYRQVENQEIVRSSGSVDTIRTVTTVNSIVSAGDLPGIAKYVNGTDYTLSGDDTISWLPGGNSPSLGSSYYLTFTETRPATAYSPILYFDENRIYENHGNETRTSGTINDVSKGGSLALQAGAKGVLVCQLNLSQATNPNSPTGQELENAFIAMRDELEKVQDWKLYLIPMSSGTLYSTSAATIFFNHAVLSSQPENKQERSVIAALEKNTTVQQAVTYAQSYSHERMIVPYAKDAISWPIGWTTEYDMRFYNAALAGKLCAGAIGLNISDEIIPNVYIKDNLTPGEQRFLVRGGVGPAKIRGEIVRNIFIGTSDTTSALTEDAGVQDIKDYVKKYWREGLWTVFRNRRINQNLLAEIDQASEGIMERLITDEIISDFKDLTSAQDTTEPRKILVTGKVQPAFGMQFMDVTFTFVLSF
jgi:hypothetical protein